MDHFGVDVNDRSTRVEGGLQRLRTAEGCVIPLIVSGGLVRLKMRPFTDHELETLLHVVLTNDDHWDPTVLDFDPRGGDPSWYNVVSEEDPAPALMRFDSIGDYRHCVALSMTTSYVESATDARDFSIGTLIRYIATSDLSAVFFDAHDGTHFDVFYDSYDSYAAAIDGDTEGIDLIVVETDQEATADLLNNEEPISVDKKNPNFSNLRPLFAWLGTDIVKKMFERTTQYGRLPMGTRLRQMFRSANPALNVQRRDEDVASDVVFSDIPAVDGGQTAGVIFVGTKTDMVDAYPIKSEKQFINTLEDNVRERGAMNRLISDRAQVEIGERVKNFLRALVIAAWQSVPYMQHQNYAERKYQTVKSLTNRVLDRFGAPGFAWFLCLTYVCFVLNHTYNPTLDDIPIRRLTGTTPDISPLLRFHFWQKVYFPRETGHSTGNSKELVGYIAGISEHAGPAMTYKIYHPESGKVLHRSICRPFTAADANLRADATDPFNAATDGETSRATVDGETNRSDALDGEMTSTEQTKIESEPPPKPVVYSRKKEGINDHQPDTNSQKNAPTPAITLDDLINAEKDASTPIINLEDLIGRTFLADANADGTKERIRIKELIDKHDQDILKNPERIKFKVTHGQDRDNEIMTYNEILQHIKDDESQNVLWKYKRINSHQGPLAHNHPNYKGSDYNVMIGWESGEISAEPLVVVAKDDPVAVAIYAKDNDLLDTPGWKRFKSIARRHKKYIRLVNQAKLQSYRHSRMYMFGFDIPKTYAEAIRMDKENGNTKWAEPVERELTGIDNYSTFEDLGHKDDINPPNGYQRIKLTWTFAVKHDGRFKARLCRYDGRSHRIGLLGSGKHSWLTPCDVPSETEQPGMLGG